MADDPIYPWIKQIIGLSTSLVFDVFINFNNMDWMVKLNGDLFLLFMM